jgi:hypothetical protein
MKAVPAITGALNYALTFQTGSWKSKLVNRLTYFALGRENAKPWGWLKNEIPEIPSKEAMQNMVVIPSRKSGTKCFICSCNAGYYIPVSDDDIKAMEDFYTTRIAQETYHLNVLRTWAATV